MPVQKAGSYTLSRTGTSVASLTNIAGTADNTVAAARVDTLANLGADSDANDRDLAAKINEILVVLRDAGIINS